MLDLWQWWRGRTCIRCISSCTASSALLPQLPLAICLCLEPEYGGPGRKQVWSIHRQFGHLKGTFKLQGAFTLCRIGSANGIHSEKGEDTEDWSNSFWGFVTIRSYIGNSIYIYYYKYYTPPLLKSKTFFWAAVDVGHCLERKILFSDTDIPCWLCREQCTKSRVPCELEHS